jgi:Mg2+-importing ATPase
MAHKNTTETSGSFSPSARLKEASLLGEEELFKKEGLSIKGLEETEVEVRREKYGSNEIARKKKNSIPKRLLLAFVTPFTIVLFVLAGISLFTDIILAKPENRSYLTVIMVLSMVMISGLMTFIQDFKSEKAAEKLSAMVRNTATVIRGGAKKDLPFSELVVGDRVVIASGDMIPADLRLVETKDLFVNQAALTGESEPIEKTSGAETDKQKTSLESVNIALMGSNVISGAGQGIVICTGKDTLFGSLAEKLTNKKAATSFDVGISKVSWMLIRFILIMAPVVFLINGLFKTGDNKWMNALLFALSVAVGLTPEMLPMIVSANLAKSAVVMSKNKVIIKNLSSIQNLGAMDVLCTDKTGTLTEDRIALEYHCNIMGQEDKRVLRHAFLNSYYQTGLKNVMDTAIISHGEADGLGSICQNYHKVDEIPFDFCRRRMSVVVEDSTGKRQLITKGAVEEMLSVSSFAEYDGKVEPLTTELKTFILEKADEFNRRGFRVLALAHKNSQTFNSVLTANDENDMVLIGYLAFFDPPKATAQKAIKDLNDYGVAVKILTGDNDAITAHICSKVGLAAEKIILGSEIEKMSEEELENAVEKYSVFAKLSPAQKVKVVSALKKKHTVGFMGDGINDAGAMKTADVGISVDTAVDIAKESSDIILTEKDLGVLKNGLIEGRKTYANTMKYIKITSSSNFGNMLSILAASIFLPFLPMSPLQILILNMIYDISCLALPFDKVDEDYLKIPRKWEAKSISRFMLWFGPLSSLFDITTYLMMYFLICPQTLGAGYAALDSTKQLAFAALFEAGWFVESQWSQTIIIHTLRTEKMPFIHSQASWLVYLMSAGGIIVSTLLALFVGFGNGKEPLNWIFFIYLIGVLIFYILLVTLVKKIYIRKYKELI